MKKESPSSKNSKSKDAAITVAIIALIGTLITAVFTSPILAEIVKAALVATPTLPIGVTPNIEITPTIVSTGKHIAFISERDGNREIYLMKLDGSSQINLTKSAVDESSYVWSPDGTRIAFVRSDQLFTLDVNTLVDVQVTNFNVWDYTIAWSPDGKKLLFISNQNGIGIYTVNVDGSELTKITTDIIPDINDAPSWSPDSTQIAFATQSDDNNKGKVFIINADGTNLHLAVDIDNVYPAWSPNGRYLGLSTIGFGGNDQNNYPIYVFDIATENLITIANKGEHSTPSWAPDSTKLLFDKSGDIYMASPDGSNLSLVLSLDSFAKPLTTEPSFSPDGTEILYTCNGYSVSIEQPYNTEICTMNINSSKVTRLTTSSAVDSEPSWQP